MIKQSGMCNKIYCKLQEQKRYVLQNPSLITKWRSQNRKTLHKPYCKVFTLFSLASCKEKKLELLKFRSQSKT